MNRRAFRFFVFLSLMAPVAYAADAAEALDHLISGNKFAQEKKYTDAVREYQTAVRLDPQNADANLLLGLTLANTGDLDGAIQYTLAAIQLKPSYSAYYNLGLVYANEGKFLQAVEAYENAVKITPESYQAWHQLGMVYAADLKFDKAIEAYQKVVELNPKFAQGYQGLGSSYYWDGNKEAALNQVAKLNELKLGSMALELERWILDKEAKKNNSAKKSAAKKIV